MAQHLTDLVCARLRANLILPSRIGAVGLTFAVGIAYFFAAQLSFALIDQSDGVALFWPAAGVSSGVLISLGRVARLPVASAVIAATIIINLMDGRGVWSATALALSNAGQALLTAWLVERYFGSSFALDRLRNVFGLLAAAVAAAAASGIGGVASFKLFHSPTAPMWTTWQHWSVSGAIGIITVAPLIIGLGNALREPPPRNEVLEGVLVLVALTAVIIIITVLLGPEPWHTVRLAALLLPILLWLTTRCRPACAAAAAFIASLAIVWTITFGIGHFGDPRLPISDRILDAQATIIGFALYTYVLAALFAERRQAEERLQQALTAGAVIAFRCNAITGLAQLSENAAPILGLGPQQVFTVAQFFARIHPDDLARVKAHYRRTDANSPATLAFRFIRPDGREVWLEETSQAEFDAAGRLICVKGLTRDITTRKQAETHQNVLIAELDHRVKNLLARVGAIIVQTSQRRTTVDEFVRALRGRIQSMAAAHALLSKSRWSGVSLTHLVHHQLAPHATDANITISGPEIMLTSAQTQALAMVIHELVTNAAKYGALSIPDGRVSVNWDRAGADTSAVLTVIWREFGGPPIKAQVRLGYGSNLIRDLIPHELGGAVDLTFPSDGACCKIEIPL
jgi:PAS domain S-box-containing protein